jgi:hypothetical protein
MRNEYISYFRKELLKTPSPYELSTKRNWHNTTLSCDVFNIMLNMPTTKHNISISFIKDLVHTTVTTDGTMRINPVSMKFYYGMSPADMFKQVFKFLNAHFAYVQELKKLKEAASLLTIMSQKNEDISPKQAMSRLMEGKAVWRKVMGIVYRYSMEDGVMYCSWIEDDKEKCTVSDMSIKRFMSKKMKWYI